MVLREFVVCIYLIVGESSLQLIEVLQLQYTLVFQGLVSLILDLRRFLLNGCGFRKMGVVNQTCGPPLLPKLQGLVSLILDLRRFLLNGCGQPNVWAPLLPKLFPPPPPRKKSCMKPCLEMNIWLLRDLQ